ncbi:hypothetical protein MTO98_22905 [Mucilaginibacter sp. SMC90]|uniref:hypothetical protein n=1 Tax=Mucilaginibacter sp. SMC90 TaxID=2929803 RepID=UPI001FB1D27E|nr:hypothetical protein [Mucilaginibacter sp. SMC90]UOE47258.1 hypothetical protein MTO98_22905 [Mucilaginibacter sp. SMC90]
MKFIERYLSGEGGTSVYEDIYGLKEKAFQSEHFDDVYAVLTETFKRVTFNLNVIYQELNNINYVFKTVFTSNSDKPLVLPLPNTDNLISELEDSVADFGKIPLSLKLFYQIVGTCNFAWDYENQPNLLWEGADPIQIASLDDLVDYVTTDEWKEYISDSLEYDEDEIPALELAADYLHKDNISGGPAYSLEITKDETIDGLFLNECNETTFINYLRICIENCGFPGNSDFRQSESYKNFCLKVKPKLKSI